MYESVSFSVVGSPTVAWQAPCAFGMDIDMADDPPVLWLKPEQVTDMVKYVAPDQVTATRVGPWPLKA